MDAIRTEIGVGAPGRCPIAKASECTQSSIDHITRSSATNRDGLLTEEFTTDRTDELDEDEFEKVFELDSRVVYRFDRERDLGCVCDHIESYGCPVTSVHARDGTLVVSFYAPDIESIREIIRDLNDAFDEINLRQLTRSDTHTEDDLVLFDRSHLTARQREVLETSHRMGYFEHPKGANAGDVSRALDIAPSTFSEHLAAAQRKLLHALIE